MTHSDGSDNSNFDGNTPPILLPYQKWFETAHRQVTINALKYAAQNGLPGNHSFYLTFITSYPGVSVPARLKAQYPDDITIVLQHQFWDLIIDEKTNTISVGLSFGGVASTLVIPFGAMTAFSDPEAKLLLAYAALPSSSITDVTNLVVEDAEETGEKTNDSHEDEHQVISLDAFRKKHD